MPIRDSNTSDSMREPEFGEDTLEPERLRLAIETGIAALDSGNYSEIEDKDLDAYLDNLVELSR